MTDLFSGALNQGAPRPPQTHNCTGPGCFTCRAMAHIPATPYAGTSGWSGSDTSKARAVDADQSGITASRQRQTLTYLEQRGAMGATWRELADATDWHHGTASGVLSVLHKTGAITRLAMSRDRCKVYVLPAYVHGRRTEGHGREHTCPACGHTY